MSGGRKISVASIISPASTAGHRGKLRSGFTVRPAVGRAARHSSVVTRHFWLSSLLISLFAASVTFGDNRTKPTLESLGNQLMCKCGCVAPLNQCPHFDCAEKAEMQAFLKKEIAEGKGEAVILQDVAQRYGLQVLTAPPARGFNLTVWVLPSIGLLTGLGIVVVVVRRWRHKPALDTAPGSTGDDPKLIRAVEEEMKSMRMG